MKIKISMLIVFIIGFVFFAINAPLGNMQAFNDIAYKQIEPWITPSLTSIMTVITNLGEWYVYTAIAVVLLAIPKTRRRVGTAIAITTIASVIINTVLKYAFAVSRPDVHQLVSATGFGFPSGHAMNGTVFVGMCALMLIRYYRKNAHKAIVFTSAFGFMLVMGFSRVYLGVHTVTDILAGYLAGCSILTAATMFFGQKTKLLRFR